MNKKLIAVAVAGLFVAPAAALAQSSVTISGAITMSVDNLKISNPGPARTGLNTSESRLNDQSSSVIFNVREDLGGGMTALVLVDVKVNPDSSAISVGGASWIGLSTPTAGRFTAGRHNFHFFKSGGDGYARSLPLQMLPGSLTDYAGAGAVGIATSRTPNSLMWSSPNWGGFTMDAGYSFNPAQTGRGPQGGTETDLSSGARKGRAWMLNPTFTGSNWQIAYSYWSSKTDSAAATLAQADQRSDKLYGYYTWGGFKLAAQWDKTRLNTATGPTAGTRVSDRTAWTIPILYTMGNHNFLAHYTKARDDKATPLVQDGAKMWMLGYAYTLSKRTSVSLSYAKIRNDAGAAYDFFFSGLISGNAIPTAGEDPRLIAVGMRHTF